MLLFKCEHGLEKAEANKLVPFKSQCEAWPETLYYGKRGVWGKDGLNPLDNGYLSCEWKIHLNDYYL